MGGVALLRRGLFWLTPIKRRFRTLVELNTGLGAMSQSKPFDVDGEIASMDAYFADLRENPTVFKRAYWEAGKIHLGWDVVSDIPALVVLTQFFHIPQEIVAKELGLTKGRLSQLLSSDEPLPTFRRAQLNAAARQALLAWERHCNTHHPDPKKDPFGAAAHQIIKATVNGARQILDKEERDLSKAGKETKA